MLVSIKENSTYQCYNGVGNCSHSPHSWRSPRSKRTEKRPQKCLSGWFVLLFRPFLRLLWRMTDSVGQKTTPPWALIKTTLVFSHITYPLAVVEFQQPSNGSFRFNSDVSPVTELISDWFIPLRERHQPDQRAASYTVAMVMNVNIRAVFHWKNATFKPMGNRETFLL